MASSKKVSKKETKKETKDLAKKVVNHKKTVSKNNDKKDTVKVSKSNSSEKKLDNEKNDKNKYLIGIENKKMKTNKFSLLITVIGIIACMGCVYADLLNSTYTNMPLYAILLFIILIEDKK